MFASLLAGPSLAERSVLKIVYAPSFHLAYCFLRLVDRFLFF
jgi:hypothetical protein